MNSELKIYRDELRQELNNILKYWMTHAVDLQNGGFAGKIDNDNHAEATAAKGAVLNSRILWTFSAAYKITHTAQHLQMAERAFKYIANFIIDKDYGGVFWTVDYRGKPLDTKKQIYAVSFAIYGLSEYYSAWQDEKAKKLAIDLYKAVVDHSYEPVHGGYIESLARDWKQIKDLRLSEKDANARKSMNTHLHLLESFANLYRVWPDAGLRVRIAELIQIFLDHIIDAKTNHLRMFFDDAWTSNGDSQSYGHDIEAAWLIGEAAELINDKRLIELVAARSVKLADAAAEGLDHDGGIWYEFDPSLNKLVREKHWWPQAEAMVGFFNAWQLTGDDAYLKKSLWSWDFVKRYILNQQNGEWYWGVTADHQVMPGEDKVGLWKCPYHNGRACMEIIHRINTAFPALDLS